MELLLIIAFIALITGSYTDIRTREVPDWLNKGLVSIGIGLSLLLSVLHSNWNYFFNSLIGFVAFFILALVMYYSGQWGGGDSKMIMGIGAAIGLDLMNLKNSFLLAFLLNSLIIGAVYGILWSAALSIKNTKKVVREARQLLKKKAAIKRYFTILSLVFLVLTLFVKDSTIQLILVFLILGFIFLFYIWVYIKSVENACMLKYVAPDKLTEGDWIAKNVMVNKKIIAGPKDLGIGKKQITKLLKLYNQKKIKKVLIKEGIPFVPSFLIAFIVSYLWGNLLWIFV